MRINKKQVLLIVALSLSLIFFFVLSRILNNEIEQFDDFVYGLFYRNEVITGIMKAITFMGEGTTLILLSLAILIFMKDKILGMTIPFNLFLIGSINIVLKSIVKRARPVGIRLIEIGGYSFPSGHSASSLAFYGFLMYLIYKKCKNKKLKIASIIGLGLLILSIGISRIYLGVHYASDVLGGFLLSGAYLAVYVIAISKIVNRQELSSKKM